MLLSMMSKHYQKMIKSFLSYAIKKLVNIDNADVHNPIPVYSFIRPNNRKFINIFCCQWVDTIHKSI